MGRAQTVKIVGCGRCGNLQLTSSRSFRCVRCGSYNSLTSGRVIKTFRSVEAARHALVSLKSRQALRI